MLAGWALCLFTWVGGSNGRGENLLFRSVNDLLGNLACQSERQEKARAPIGRNGI